METQNAGTERVMAELKEALMERMMEPVFRMIVWGMWLTFIFIFWVMWKLVKVSYAVGEEVAGPLGGIGAVLAVLLVVVGIGGFAVANSSVSQPPPASTKAVSSPSSGSPSSSSTRPSNSQQGGGSEKTMYMSPSPSPSEKPKAATPDTSKGKTSANKEVEDAIRSHYGAIGDGNFEKAFSYFGPTFRSTNTEEGWVDNERTSQIRSSTVNDVNVEAVSGSTATVDVSFRDKTGTPRFVLTWDMIRDGGGWKLDSQTSGQKVN